MASGMSKVSPSATERRIVGSASNRYLSKEAVAVVPERSWNCPRSRQGSPICVARSGSR